MGETVPWVRSYQSPRPFYFFLRVILANKSRMILVGAAVSLVRILATATVVFSDVVRVIANTGTELPHRTLQSRHIRGALTGHSIKRAHVSLQISPDLEHSMALSGVHLFVVREVINEDPVASDIAVYNARHHAVNSVLVTTVFRSEGG